MSCVCHVCVICITSFHLFVSHDYKSARPFSGRGGWFYDLKVVSVSQWARVDLLQYTFII